MRLKERPEDFIVRERIQLKTEEGSYGYFLMRKIGWSTEDVLERMCEKLHIKRGHVGVAGYKDKDAITEQFVSLLNIPKERVLCLLIPGVTFSYLGNGKQPIFLGMHEGNSFRITVRGLERKKNIASISFKNIFDEQRFIGGQAEIGRMLLQRNYRGVCERLNIAMEGKDYLGSLRNHGVKRLRFCVNSFQSLLFNKVIYQLKKRKASIPLIGYLTELKHDAVGKICRKIMQEEEISPKDFLFRDFPELSNEGVMREMTVRPKNLKVEWKKDEFHNGKLACILTFDLPKGAYATAFVKELFNNKQEEHDPNPHDKC